MSISSTAVKAPTKYNILLLLALIIAGLAGNYFKYPIFLNIDFLFGGIFALLALQFFGFGRGIMAAAVIAGYTFLLWNHPYAIIIQTAEVAFVGWLMCRRRVGMVLSDTLFWLILGMPLVYLFYHVVMHVPLSSVYITMTKQAVNGIANALIARLIFNGYALRSRSSKMSFREIVYNLLTVFVLTPTLILLAVSSRSDFNETDQHIRLTLNDGSARLNHYISTWVGSRKATIVNLADLAASRTPQQLQPHLEFINKSDVNFPRVGLLDKTATITAYAPLVDEFGVSNIGISAADRPYVQTLRKTLKPMLSEVLMGRVIKSFGYTLEDIPTLDVWWELAYPDPEYRQMIICEWSSHFDNANNGIFEPLEAKIRCKDGTTRTVLASAAPLQESFAGEHLVILFDITERMLAENALLESHRFLDSIIDQSSINMWVSDSKGTLLRANEALRRQLNVTDDELVGIYNIFEDPIVVGQGFLPQVLEVFDKGQATRFTINYDTSHNHNLNPEKRSQAILEVTISPVLNSDGVVTNAIIQHFDISELKQLEHELKEAKTVAESANRAKSEFLANMSHEIRTPLHGLLGMAQLLEMTPLTEEQKEYLAALKLSGKNLVSLINDILDLSKIEAGKITIEMNEFSLRCAIDEVYLMQKSAIFFKNLSFRVTIDEQIPHLIQGDQLRVKQIIHNLLGNAAKFTKQGGITIAARIHELHYGSCVIEISVTDTGIGIAAEALEKIFNPFVQEDGSTTRQFGGTGLGLTISRHLTELMGGSISVVSSQGVGSTFKIKLPFIIPAALHTTEIKAPLAVPLWDAPPLRILLVEDNPVNQIYCRALLGMHGHEIMTAENGEECLEAVDRVQFDLILMDIQMPLMNGREALRAIRSKEERTSRHQRVIALTAHALHGAKENFLAEGFDGYLSKPMEQGALITEMKRVMNLTFGSN